MTYKALSLKQPWLYLIASGIKKIETRTWKTNYRGDILLCSSLNKANDYKNIITSYQEYYKIKNNSLLLEGYALCLANLYDCKEMIKQDEEKACCKIYEKAHSWFLKDIRLIEPIKVKGQLNLFNINLENIKIIKYV